MLRPPPRPSRGWRLTQGCGWSGCTKRGGCATLLTAAGVEPRGITEILGHSQISSTMDVYTHVVRDTQREAISHKNRLLKRRLPAA